MMEKRGAVFFICGDAATMQLSAAKTWQKIYQELGKKTPEESTEYIKTLQANGRYVVDVWG